MFELVIVFVEIKHVCCIDNIVLENFGKLFQYTFKTMSNHSPHLKPYRNIPFVFVCVCVRFIICIFFYYMFCQVKQEVYKVREEAPFEKSL